METVSKEKSYWFSIEDPAWRSHLFERGYVVVKQVALANDVDYAKSLIWNDLEGAEGIDRNDLNTWKKWCLPAHGLVASLAQTAGPWYIRGLPRVKEVFSRIWETPDLITSMDAVIIWRPWLEGAKVAAWRPKFLAAEEVPEEPVVSTFESFPPPRTEGLHLDQNPFTKPYLDCIQGMVPLYPVTRDFGGLEVIPFSHTDEQKEKFMSDFPRFEHMGDFCLIPGRSPHCANPLLLEAEAGDLILWDSRTIHGGKVGRGLSGIVAEDSAAAPNAADGSRRVPMAELARMTCTVSMTPRAWASEEVQASRSQGFEEGLAFNHCPHEAGTSAGTIHACRKLGYRAFELSAAQRALL